MIARPFVKWAGGKTKLVPYLRRFVTQPVRRYYEPMVGAGAFFFHMLDEKCFEHARINDVNAELIATYRMILTQPESLIAALSVMGNSEENFKKVRASSTDKRAVAVASRFIYLNKTCFNGLYRVNADGQFNVSFGNYDRPKICDADNIRACHLAMAARMTGNDVTCDDFEECVKGAKKGDFVYFDPPYWPVSKTASFTKFTADGFTAKDQGRLAACFGRLARKGVQVVLSNSDTAETRYLYKGHRIESVRMPRSINSNGPGRDPVGEIVVHANCRVR